MDIKIKKMNRNETKAYKEKLEKSLLIAEEEGIPPGSVLNREMQESLKLINSDVKKETAEQYRKLVEAKIKNSDKDLVSHLFDCGTKNSFDKTRSAFRFCIAEKINELRKESDKARKQKDFETMRSKTAEAYALYYVFDRDFLSDSRIVWGDISYKKKESASKKKTMNNVSTIKAVFEDLKNKPDLMNRYGMILALSSLTGCRPEEIQKGIEITREDTLINICISGAKVGKDRGQDKRKITFMLDKYRDNEQMIYILDSFRKLEKSYIYHCDKKDYNALRQYLYLNHRGLSLYTFRHRVASELKKEGLSELNIAAFLGHRTTKSQENYGYARSAKKGLSVANVECTSAIKSNKRGYGTRSAAPGASVSRKIKIR